MKKSYLTLLVLLLMTKAVLAQISGTLNYVPKFNSTTTVGNSLLYDSGSNVGIGTASPGASLDVYSPSASIPFQYTGAYNKFKANNGFTDLESFHNTRLVIDFTNSYNDRYFSVSKGASYISGGTPTELFRVQENGNVGIGTASPNANLTVAGTTIGSVSAAGIIFRANSTATSGMVTGFYANPATSATTNIGVNANALNGTNNINILTGNNAAPTGNWDVYANSNADNYFSGKVGIGAPSASTKLSVTGTGTTTGRAFAIKDLSAVDKFVVLDNGTTTFSGGGTIGSPPNIFAAGSNVIAAMFGSGSTTGFTADQFGGAYRFNGAGVAWGDMAYFPNGGGNGNQGNFRLSMTDWYINTVPSGKLGVGELYSVGNVGIGTSSPGATLHIVDAGTNGINSLKLNNKMVFRGDGVLSWGLSADFGILSWDTGKAIIGSQSGKDLSLITNGSEKAIITSDGNMGIGTSRPDQKLAVNGTVHAKEVKIDLTGWPDYVFRKGYILLPLNKLKIYVDKNQHLPEIPSEQEMIKNGLKLSEMNSLLTKKLEELTLYIIAQDKQLTELKQQVASITKALNKK